ncbi:unnamed protein product [Rodentolepis nana]|uniref:DUF5744 domain-containing protein n=1 Tax=Rodentolepis nana TaxID=102285 RepID=A0A0R3T9G1_RODNA|nr:unnamed protein product [Rodentolepis nana]
MQGEYTYHRKLHNAPMRYYYSNYRKGVKDPDEKSVPKFKRFPIDSHTTSCFGDVLNGWHPPTSDQPWLMLTMPEVGALAESANKVNIYGSLMMETELKVHFFTDPPYGINNGQRTIDLEDLVFDVGNHTITTLTNLRK